MGESASEHSILAVAENFDDFLQSIDDNTKNLQESEWIEFKEAIASCNTEASMYPILAKLLTRICISVCNPRTFMFSSCISSKVVSNLFL